VPRVWHINQVHVNELRIGNRYRESPAAIRDTVGAVDVQIPEAAVTAYVGVLRRRAGRAIEILALQISPQLSAVEINCPDSIQRDSVFAKTRIEFHLPAFNRSSLLQCPSM
jgi:hypothetical protein